MPFPPSPEFFKWIDEHKADDPARLRLRHGASFADEILQIESRRKHAAKLPGILAADSTFVFPTALSGEQATGEALARWHASLFRPGERVADLTAGLGIDAMEAARAVGTDGNVVAVERDQAVADALSWNARLLPQMEVVNADCREVVKAWVADGIHFDSVFIDPARRAADGSRVFSLADCEPDVVGMLPDLERLCKRLIIKASPMLDITHTLSLLPRAAEVVCLGTTTECKELDIICDFASETIAEPLIKAITIGNGFVSEFVFTRSQEANATISTGKPAVGGYVCEPYPAVMKAAPLKLLGERFGLTKASANSHLWFSATAVEGFPGRQFRITEILPYMSKHIKRYASAHPAISVTTRNFDMTAEALRAKLRVKDGPGRLFAVTLADGSKVMITCDEGI